MFIFNLTINLGSKPSLIASEDRLAESTKPNMKIKAAASDHQAIGSRAISSLALL
jgi:hypothetical protein